MCLLIGNTTWPVHSKLGLANPGLVRNLISDLKALKEYLEEFFLYRIR